MITKHRNCVHKTEALCILLHRLSYPKRLAGMRKTFGRSEGALSRIVLHMGKYTVMRPANAGIWAYNGSSSIVSVQVYFGSLAIC
ncbi:hypothetical protein PI125_g19548 [Phytophthora idaei]|nr:hypothetical protein PI125_g19548 [Phytophthora idaei]KAG3135961.1 hypothetical protein PI126_g18021 [Phytophthora idaei]